MFGAEFSSASTYEDAMAIMHRRWSAASSDASPYCASHVVHQLASSGSGCARSTGSAVGPATAATPAGAVPPPPLTDGDGERRVEDLPDQPVAERDPRGAVADVVAGADRVVDEGDVAVDRPGALGDGAPWSAVARADGRRVPGRVLGGPAEVVVGDLVVEERLLRCDRALERVEVRRRDGDDAGASGIASSTPRRRRCAERRRATPPPATPRRWRRRGRDDHEPTFIGTPPGSRRGPARTRCGGRW